MATVSGQDEQRPLLEVVNPDATPIRAGDSGANRRT